MTVPTRQPNTSRPYPVAGDPIEAPGPRSDPNGWVPVIIAGVVAAFVIAIAGVIAGLVVVNIRESAPRAAKPAAASAPLASTPPAAPLTMVLPPTSAPLTTVAAAIDTLDPVAVQRGVVKVLGESYGLDDVREVKCPAEQLAEIGTAFDCTAKVDGVRKTVTVTVIEHDGTYEVSRPH